MRQEPDATTTSERDSLGQYLDYQRETILLKTEGLTKEQLAQKIPTSDLTLAGILYHLALVEEDWFEVEFLGRADREDWQGIDWEADPNYEFRTALEKEPDWLRRRYRDACNRARQVSGRGGQPRRRLRLGASRRQAVHAPLGDAAPDRGDRAARRARRPAPRGDRRRRRASNPPFFVVPRYRSIYRTKG